MADDDCIRWIQDFLGECASTPLQIAGVVVALLSIVIWIFAQAPQVILNFRQGHAESLSLLFLFLWLFGDSCNLVGALLSNQLRTQVYTAAYFVFMDSVLLGQYFTYQIFRPWLKKRRSSTSTGRASIQKNSQGYHVIEGEGDDSGDHTPSSSCSFPNQHSVTVTQNVGDDHGPTEHDAANQSDAEPLLKTSRLMAAAMLVSFSFVSVTNMMTSSKSAALSNSNSLHMKRQLLWEMDLPTEEAIGYAIGWVSAGLYLGSRIPQIIKNFRRKSTDGLSPLMFVLAVLGNSTYAFSIFMQMPEFSQGSSSELLMGEDAEVVDGPTNVGEYLVEKLPWLLGSFGTLVFDFIIFFQFWAYRGRLRNAVEIIEPSLATEAGSEPDESLSPEKDPLLGTQKSELRDSCTTQEHSISSSTSSLQSESSVKKQTNNQRDSRKRQ